MHSSCRVQSELRRILEIGSPSRVGCPLYRPLYDVCSPTYKGHEDLTSSPPSSGLSPAVPPECPPQRDGNWGRGLRSLRDLTQHLTTRADDSHAAPVSKLPEGHPRLSPGFLGCKDLVRFFALLRIKPHAPPLVRAPVNSFEFHPCGRTPQVDYLSLSLGH